MNCPATLSLSCLPSIPNDNSVTSALLLSMHKATSVTKRVRHYSSGKTVSKSKSRSREGVSSIRSIGKRHGGVTHIRKKMFEKRTHLSTIAAQVSRECCSKQCTRTLCTAVSVQRERIRIQKCTTKEYKDNLVTLLQASLMSHGYS